MTSSEQVEWLQSSEVHGPACEPASDPAPRLVIFGAVPLAGTLCRAARAIDWTPYVVDPRDRFASADRFPDAERVMAAKGIPAVGDHRTRALIQKTVLASLSRAKGTIERTKVDGVVSWQVCQVA